jgi:predicted transcriptional regulator
MPTQTTRDRIIEALQDLSLHATFDDAIERLVLLAKIDAGLAELDAGNGIPHEEVKRRLGM